ncbi:hypothetical protein TRFO_10178 [Tritrichomonas foetus]|uniref:HECT-type E3 ubiquitin transferase n=1 Tax=Tritrichomonas foetus TaxID=1144522 RepID=A0A1J4JA21_9EUKA|nr:hypothetical protein TRFO_10178 [Tritrichomonas foetus]|eukprot:OHS96008.1 hypothetical protein TRFO_10178 [Tritrichomonas foetus]
MKKSNFLLPSTTIFEGAQAVDCVRQSLISLTTGKIENKDVVTYLKNILVELNSDLNDMILDDLLLVIRQCFERNDPEIISLLNLYMEKSSNSRGNLLAAIVSLNAVLKVNPEYKVDETAVQFLNKIADELAPQFHSFKPRKSYTLLGFSLNQNEAISTMLCLIKLTPIKTEAVLEAALFLWHSDAKPEAATSINFMELIEKVDRSIYQALFNSIPRERFLFLCSDPQAPSTICPSIAEKLEDFSDVPFFLKSLPLPQIHLSDESIASAIQSIKDCHILTPRLRHPLLQKTETWLNILSIIDDSSIENSAKCFVSNIVDVADTISQILLALPEITTSACKFVDEVLNQDTEARSQLSRSEMLAFVISNFQKPPPIEFWQIISSSEPFKLLEGIEEGKYPVALLGLVHYLISSNRIFSERFLKTITLPSLKNETVVALYDYIKSLDGTPKTLFGNLPKDNDVILLTAIAIYTALNINAPKKAEIVHHTKHNVLPLLTLQLYAIKSIVKNSQFIEAFLMSCQETFDSLQEAIKNLHDPISDLDELCIITLYDTLMKYHPFYNNPVVVSNLILLTSYVWVHQTVKISKGVNTRFAKSLYLLDEVLIKKPHGNRIALQVATLFTRLGRDLLYYLSNNSDYFFNKKLSIYHFYNTPEECEKACSAFFSENSTIETIRFFQRCFSQPPRIAIDSPAKIESIYRDVVSKEQWEDAAYLAGFLSNSGKIDIIQQTPEEVINILVFSRVAFDDPVPEYLMNLIQHQLSDDDTQLNAMTSYFTNIPDLSLIEITPLLLNFSKFFRGKQELVLHALSSVFAHGFDPSFPIIRRPETLPIPGPSENAKLFINKLVDAVIANPSQKMFIFLRTVIIPYAFLLKNITEEKFAALLETCFNVIDSFETLDLKNTDADHFNQIQSAILLISILVGEPVFADFFFRFVIENIGNFTAARLYITVIFINTLFVKSRLLAAIAAAYCIKNDLFNLLSSNILRTQEKSKLRESLISAFNTLITNSLTFFSNLAEIDVVDIDESIKTERPFTFLVQPGLMRSALSLTPIQAFGPFEIDEEKNHFTEMAKTILPPTTGQEFNVRGFISSLRNGESFKPAEVDSYIGFIPDGIKEELFRSMKPTERSACLRENLPRLGFITPPMMRVLLRQPSWVKVCILQNINCLLLPEHYIVLMQVIQEMKNVNDSTDLNQLRKSYIEKIFCQEEFFKVVLAVLSQKNIKKEILVDSLDNLSRMLSFGPALCKCLEFIVPILRNSVAADDLMLVYTILMVMAKTGASCEKIYSLLGDDFFVFFLQPKWRNDREKLEYISALVSTFIDKVYHKGFVLPMRILQFICFLYMNGLYRSANQISLYLTDAQKKLISPFIHSVFDHLKSLDSDKYQIDLMNLCRAYPYLNFDKRRILRTFDLLLSSSDSPNLEVLGSLINVLLPDEFMEINEEEEKKHEGELPNINFQLPVSVYNKYPEFWRVVSKHRVMLTKITHSLRFSQNATSPFKFLFMFPVIIDHQLKADYFNYRNKKELETSTPESTSNSSDNKDTNTTNNTTTTFEVQDDEHILDNSINLFKQKSFEEWRQTFTPTILGSDKDWYNEIAKALFTSDLFTLTPNNRCVQINPRCNNADLEKNLEMYKFSGFFVGLCLLHNKKINAHLAPHIFKRILGLPTTLRDVEIVDVALARSYRHILEQPATNLGLFFNATTQDQDGKNVEVELIPGGSKIPVNEENKAQFVQLMLNFRFHKECVQQLNAFVEGFSILISRKSVQMFTAQELEMLVCGVPKIDVEEMMKNVIILSPYSLEHPLIKMFTAMLKKWDQATLAKLLWFVTGSSELPVGGFAELKKKGITINIERGAEISFTPSAHTCFHTLIIPEYPTLDLMERMFFIALDENV